MMKIATAILRFLWWLLGGVAALLRRLLLTKAGRRYRWQTVLVIGVLSILLACELYRWVPPEWIPAHYRCPNWVLYFFPVAILVCAAWKLRHAKPDIVRFDPIQEVLSGGEADVVPLGRFFWEQIPRLIERAEVKRILDLWEEGENVVLLEGYPASGKSSIAVKVGRAAVELGGGDVPVFVYYLNLTTRLGYPFNVTVDSQILDRLAEDIPKTQPPDAAPIYFIIEDVHHFPENFDRFKEFRQRRDLRVLLTSRPLEEYALSERGPAASPTEDIGGGLPKECRLRLKTDAKVVAGIVAAYPQVTCHSLDAVLGLIGTKEPNLLLLAFALRAATELNKRLDQVDRDDLRDYLRRYWKAIAERLKLENTVLFAVLAPLAALSEFEVPVSIAFVAQAAAKPPETVERVLTALAKARVILAMDMENPERFPCYLLPHARLAQLHRELWVDGPRRDALLLDYLRREPLYGNLAGRLLIEARDYWQSLAPRVAKDPEFHKRNLKSASLWQLASLLDALREISLDLVREALEPHTKQLLAMSYAHVKGRGPSEVGYFIQALAGPQRELAVQWAVQRKRKPFVGMLLRCASYDDQLHFLQALAIAWGEDVPADSHWTAAGPRPADLGYVRDHLSRSSDSVVKAVVEHFREPVLDMNLNGHSLFYIGIRLRFIGQASPEMATEDARRHASNLREAWDKASPEDRDRFWGHVSGISGLRELLPPE